MKVLIESESSSKYEHDFVAGWVELSACRFGRGSFPAWETLHGSRGEWRVEGCVDVGHRISPVVGTSSPFSFVELFGARPGGYRESLTPGRFMI